MTTDDTILHQTETEAVINKEIDEAEVEERNTTKLVLGDGTADETPGDPVTVTLDPTLIPDDLTDAELLAHLRRNHRVVQTSGSVAAAFHIEAAVAEDGTCDVLCTVASLDFEIV